jgi:hypothetical protein
MIGQPVTREFKYIDAKRETDSSELAELQQLMARALLFGLFQTLTALGFWVRDADQAYSGFHIR